MKPHVRRAIAYIVGCVILKKQAPAIFDYSSSKHYNFSISISNSGIAAYDYSQQCHISGGYSSLYHYGEGCHISISMNGDRFNGFDYGQQCHFSGYVNGNSISVFDYGVGSYFNFSI